MKKYIDMIAEEIDKPPLNQFKKLQDFKKGEIFGCVIDTEWMDGTRGYVIMFDFDTPMIYDMECYKKHSGKLVEEAFWYGTADKSGWHV